MKLTMKVLVTGVKGQLGYDVMNELTKRGHKAIGVDIEEMDITDASSVEKTIKSAKVDAVIHCAAYTAVDAAEENEELCRRVNVDGTVNIAKVCGELDIKMIYISTDYIFDGQGEHYWEPDDPHKAPLNVYGQTKYEGELAVQKYVKQYYIVRIAWVFGVNGKNFIKTMLRLGKENGAVKVVEDQIGSPTYTFDLAVLLVDMVETVTPVSSSEFPAKAARPYNSRMSKEKLSDNGFERLPSWQDALSRYLKVITW